MILEESDILFQLIKSGYKRVRDNKASSSVICANEFGTHPTIRITKDNKGFVKIIKGGK